MPEFEFDPDKSRANKLKHGIDFVEAQAVWEDEDLAEAPARTEDEERTLIIGRIGQKHWAAVVTKRGGHIRLISVRRARERRKNFMKAKEFDKRFDAGEDMTKYLDLSRVKRPNRKPQRVNVDFPAWMVHSLDKEADRLGVTRQSIIKFWISERLKSKTG